MHFDFNQPKFRNPLFIAIIIGGFTSFYINYAFRLLPFSFFCPIKKITGFPCPGCGMGHAIISVFNGNYLDALNFNFLIFPFLFSIIIIVIWLFIDTIKSKNTFEIFWDTKVNLWIKYLILACIFINWIIQIIKNI